LYDGNWLLSEARIVRISDTIGASVRANSIASSNGQ